jgi:hypothetical protein
MECDVIKISFSGLASLDFDSVGIEHGKSFLAWKSNIRATEDTQYCWILSRFAPETKYNLKSSVDTF